MKSLVFSLSALAVMALVHTIPCNDDRCGSDSYMGAPSFEYANSNNENGASGDGYDVGEESNGGGEYNGGRSSAAYSGGGGAGSDGKADAGYQGGGGSGYNGGYGSGYQGAGGYRPQRSSEKSYGELLKISSVEYDVENGDDIYHYGERNSGLVYGGYRRRYPGVKRRGNHYYDFLGREFTTPATVYIDKL